MMQGGDIANNNGTGGHSIFGPTFDDENFQLHFDKPGLLAMANKNPDTNCSQFFITFIEAPHLNDRFVVFGELIGDIT